MSFTIDLQGRHQPMLGRLRDRHLPRTDRHWMPRWAHLAAIVQWIRTGANHTRAGGATDAGPLQQPPDTVGIGRHSILQLHAM
jgi:hypothetical protein